MVLIKKNEIESIKKQKHGGWMEQKKIVLCQKTI